MIALKRKNSSMKVSLSVKFVSSLYLAWNVSGYFLVSMSTVETVSLLSFLPRSLMEMLPQLTAQVAAAHPRSAQLSSKNLFQQSSLSVLIPSCCNEHWMVWMTLSTVQGPAVSVWHLKRRTPTWANVQGADLPSVFYVSELGMEFLHADCYLVIWKNCVPHMKHLMMMESVHWRSNMERKSWSKHFKSWNRVHGWKLMPSSVLTATPTYRRLMAVIRWPALSAAATFVGCATQSFLSMILMDILELTVKTIRKIFVLEDFLKVWEDLMRIFGFKLFLWL